MKLELKEITQDSGPVKFELLLSEDLSIISDFLKNKAEENIELNNFIVNISIVDNKIILTASS